MPPLTTAALLAAVLAALSGLWTVLVPRWGTALLYYRRELVFGLATIAVTLALAALGSTLGPRALLGGLLVLLLLGGAVYLAPGRLRPGLDDPDAAGGAAAASVQSAPVLGIVVQGCARAWPLSLLAAHQVINDRLGDQYVCVTR